MSLHLHCPACGTDFAVPELYAGEHGRCPQCGTFVSVPGAPTETGERQPGDPRPPVIPPQYRAPGPAAPRSNGLAIGAMVCGIIGIFMCIPLGAAGIIMGIFALLRADREPARYGGRGFAIAGICCGGISILVSGLYVAILLPSLSRARDLSKQLVCASNIKGIGTSCRIYANDFAGTWPPDLQMLVKTGDVTLKQMHCPSSGADPTQTTANYIYIAGQTEHDDPRNVVMYEPESNHGGEGANVLFLDGHVEFLKPYSEVQKRVDETRQRLRIAERP